MEIIKAPTYVKLTEKERKTLLDAYDILNELYNIIADNDCEYVDDTCRNKYDRLDIALTANVLQMLALLKRWKSVNKKMWEKSHISI